MLALCLSDPLAGEVALCASTWWRVLPVTGVPRVAVAVRDLAPLGAAGRLWEGTPSGYCQRVLPPAGEEVGGLRLQGREVARHEVARAEVRGGVGHTDALRPGGALALALPQERRRILNAELEHIRWVVVVARLAYSGADCGPAYRSGWSAAPSETPNL